ncbi:MAG: NYN domain-containing protein [Oscillospiraceae bacterium]
MISEEKKLALLIDSDNVSAKYAPFILQEAAKYGELTVKRVYGDWEKPTNGWHFPALNNAILPVQQTCYIAGKNATDFSMIIDAMDLLYSGTVDGFVLVTSDSDFTRLAIRLREAGKLVVGIGEVKTPIAFTSSCHHFSFLNQVCAPADDFDEKSLRESIVEFVKDSGTRGIDLTKLDSFITSKYGNIDYNRLGFNRLSAFVDSFPELKRNGTFVLVKKPKPAPAPVPAPAPKTLPTMEKIADAIREYLEVNGAERDNMMKIESHIKSLFGKIDYSKFSAPGAIVSKRFSKFVDKIPGIKRDGTSIVLFSTDAKKFETPDSSAPIEQTVEAVQAEQPAQIEPDSVEPEPVAVKTQTEPTAEPNPTEQTEQSEQSSETEKPEINAVKRFILSNTAQSEGGIVLPALGKILSQHFGKSYLKELGFRTLKQLVGGMTGVEIQDNHLIISEEFIARTDEIEKFVYDFARSEGSRSVRALSTQIKRNFPGFDYTDYGYGKFSEFINAIDGVRANGYYVEPVEN